MHQKTFWIPTIVSFLLLAAMFLYDKVRGYDDGFIYGIKFFRAWLVGQSVLLFVLAAGFGMSSKKKTTQNISLLIFSCFFFLFLLELAAFVFLSIKKDIGRPLHHLLSDANDLRLHKKPHWGDFDPHFAKWRTPYDTLRRDNCQGDPLLSVTNAIGARDKDRTKDSEESRVLFLGDSFIEGFMVNASDRMTDVLEQRTGIEHLNFGINGTSPINYYLTYKHLAKQYDHDVVVVGILPGNDFEDFRAETKPELIQTPIYRPYWAGKSPEFRLEYSLASLDQSAHSLYHLENPNKISSVIDSVFCSLSFKQKSLTLLEDNSYLWHLVKWLGQQGRSTPDTFSRFNTYSQTEWEIFQFSLEKLLAETSGKRVVLLLLPILNDLKAYDLVKKNRIAQDLSTMVKPFENVSVVSLLELIHQHPERWEEFYVLCDGHWSTAGEKFAAEALLSHDVYRKATRIDVTEKQ